MEGKKKGGKLYAIDAGPTAAVVLVVEADCCCEDEAKEEGNGKHTKEDEEDGVNFGGFE
jgi:hypothetical protein